MNCHQTRRLLSVRKEWTRGEQVLVEAHLAGCPACQAVAREYELMDRRLSRLPGPEPATVSPAGAWARMSRQQNVPAQLPSWQRRTIQGAALVLVLSLVVTLGAVLSTNRAPTREGPDRAGSDSTPISLPLGGVPLTGPAGGDGRINLLLLGLDRRGGTGWAYRTDTIVVVTVDPVAHTAAMLSIPRDLQVTIPGVGEERINTAHTYGESLGLAGSGPALLEQTIEANFSIPIDYYIMVDFEGFVESIDALGGIDVDVPETLHDTGYPDPRPGDPYAYTTIHFDAGRQHMDGERALAYARSRMSTTDLDRARRQQRILLAIREKALGTNLVPRLPELLAAMGDKIRTDLDLEKVLDLASLLSEIDAENIKGVVLEEPAVYAHRRENGGSVLLPRWDLIRPLLSELFSTPQAGALDEENSTPVAKAPSTLQGYGIQVHVLDQDPGPIVDAVHELGFGWIKQQVQWKQFEPARGAYDWDALDATIEAADTAGLDLLWSIVVAPEWARTGQDLSVDGPPNDPQDLADFLGAVAGRYCGGSLKAIEVWNEQNWHGRWGNMSIDPAAYMELLKPAYEAIESTCPGITVISGALMPTGAPSPAAQDTFQYLEGMYQNGLKEYSDAVGLHLPAMNLPPGTDWRTYDDPAATFRGPFEQRSRTWSFQGTAEAVRKVMEAQGDTRPVWVTEVGWAVSDDPPVGWEYAADNTPEEQARFTVRAFEMAREWGWVQAMFLFNLNLSVVGPDSPQAMWSVVDSDWTRTETFAALAAMEK